MHTKSLHVGIKTVIIRHMKQGMIHLTDPELAERFNEFRGGIRQTTFSKVLLILFWWHDEFTSQQSRYEQFVNTKEPYVVSSWENFIYDLKPQDIAPFLRVSKRTAWDYVEFIKKFRVLS